MAGLRSWLRAPLPTKRPRRPARLLLDALEDRAVPTGFSTYLGGSLADGGRGIAVDAAGNTYLAAFSRSADIPVTFGGASGDEDIYLAKLAPDGGLLWATLVGGSAEDRPWGLALDGSGNVYVAGETQSADFPITAGAYQETIQSQQSTFVMKVEGTTGAVVYSTFFTGDSYVKCDDIAVDGTGSAYITGRTAAGNLATPGAYQTERQDRNLFVAKFKPDGSGLDYTTYLGSREVEFATAIAVDGTGSAYVTGYTNSQTFPTTAGAFQPTKPNTGAWTGFVTKLDPSGGALVYSTYLGSAVAGDGSTFGNGIALDPAGSAYVTGETESLHFPITTGAFQPSPGGGGDAFMAKLLPDGSGLAYATFLGGAANDYANSVAVDSGGHALVTGQTDSTAFPTTADAFSTTSGGAGDAFVAKFGPDGTALVYSTYLGGTGLDRGYGVAADAAGNSYATGVTGSTDFPTTAGALQTTYGGDFDIFVTKLAIGVGTLPPTVTINQAASQPDPTAGPTVNFDVEFAAPVTEFDAADIDLTGSTVGGTLSAQVSGSETAYTVTVIGMAGAGTVVASIPAGAAVGPAGASTLASTSTDNSVKFDGVVPTVTIDQAAGQADPTNTGPLLFDVVFSEPVLGLDRADVVATSSIGDTLVVSVTPGIDPSRYTVSVSGMTGTSTVTATIPAGGTTDGPGNPNVASTSTDNSIVYDITAPTVTVNQASAQSDPAGGASVAFDVVFSESVTGFTGADIDFTGSTAPGTLGASVSGSGATYTVTATGMTAGGKVVASIPAAAVTDLAGNDNLASTSTDNSVTIVQSGTVQFSSSAYVMDETGAANLLVTVTRVGGTDGPLAVNYTTADDTAVAGTNYSTTSGILNWADGDAADKTFSVPILDDGLFGPDLQFGLALSGISQSGALGSPAAATVTIRGTAAIEFTAANTPTNEDTPGVIQLFVRRGSQSVGPVSVTYAITAGTATSGSDYMVPVATGVLTWVDGDTTDKPIDFSILDDTLSEGRETILLTLSGVTGNAALGAQATATLTIAHSEGKAAGTQFTDADGDLVTPKLGGKVGTLTYYLTNGSAPISEIVLANTEAARSVVSLPIRKPRGGTGDGRVQIGEIVGIGTAGVKSLSLARADLVGAGINLGGFVSTLTIGDVRNEADITLMGVAPTPRNAAVAIAAGVIGDETDIVVTAPLGRLKAVAVGHGTITAPSVGSITVTGKKATKTTPAIPGDFQSDLTVSGAAIDPVKGKALKSLKVAGSVTGSTLSVDGNVGLVSVGAFTDSRLFAGYSGPDAGDPAGFTGAFTIGPFQVKGTTNGFAGSYVIATSFKNVSLASVGTTAGPKYGFVYRGSMTALTVKVPSFKFDVKGPVVQDLTGSDFEVRRV